MTWITAGFGLIVLLWLLDARTRRAARRGAREALEMNKALYSGTHEFVGVDPTQFRRVDLRYYDSTRSWLEREGFRMLGDVEDLTVTRQSPLLRTFIRVLSGDDGTVVAGIYHVRPTGFMRLLQAIGLMPRNMRVLDLQTEFDDGRFVVTSNTEGVDTTTSPSSILLHRVPLAKRPDRLLSLHRQRVRELLEVDESRLRCVRSINDALAAEERLQFLKSQSMQGKEAVAAMIAGQPGSCSAKKMLIKEVERA